MNFLNLIHLIQGGNRDCRSVPSPSSRVMTTTTPRKVPFPLSSSSPCTLFLSVFSCIIFSAYFFNSIDRKVFDAITTSPKSLQTLLQCLLPTPPKSSFVTIRLSKEGLKLVVGGLRFAWQCSLPMALSHVPIPSLHSLSLPVESLHIVSLRARQTSYAT
jgi:hypothetical protein